MAKRETKAELKARVDHVLAALDQEYGTEYVCYLNHETPWGLLLKCLLLTAQYGWRWTTLSATGKLPLWWFRIMAIAD